MTGDETLDWQEWPDADSVVRSYWAEGRVAAAFICSFAGPDDKWGLYQSDRGRDANAIPAGLTFDNAKATAAEWDREYHGVGEL
jgi:hypothetical protein